MSEKKNALAIILITLISFCIIYVKYIKLSVEHIICIMLYSELNRSIIYRIYIKCVMETGDERTTATK